MKIRFVLKEAFAGLTRNVTMTVAMIITTAISLALLATGVLITNMTADTKELYLDRIEVMVQLDDEISANDLDCSSDVCKDIRDTLENDDDVESVTYRNKDQSYERFVELFGQSDPVLVEQTSQDAFLRRCTFAWPTRWTPVPSTRSPRSPELRPSSTNRTTCVGRRRISMRCVTPASFWPPCRRLPRSS